MRDVYFKCGDGFFEGSPKFLSCVLWREAAATIARFAEVLFVAEPFLDKTATYITLDVSNEELFISGVDSVLASRSFDLFPGEEELIEMLFGMLAELAQQAT